MSIDSGLRRLALRTLLAAFPGPSAPEWSLRLLSDGLAGHTLFGSNVTGPAQVAGLTSELRAVRHDVLLAIDEEAGDVTRLHATTGSPYPGNMALGAIDDPASTHDIYRSVGTDLAALGLNLNLAPTADVNTTSHNPVIGTRAFSADPAVTARHTAAAVRGLQSTGVAACAKHFPGHGSTTADSHTSLPVVDLDPSRDLPPFRAAIEAGTQAIMTAHIRIPALTGPDPATFSPAILHTLLRQELSFEGAIVTDALSMAGAVQAAGDVGTAAVRSLAAGADLLCLGRRVTLDLVDHTVDAIATAVADGSLPASRLEDAATRTAALTTWATPPPTPAPGDSARGPETARRALRAEGDPALGLETARRALRVEGDPALGLETARRALRVEGDPTGFADALLIQLDAASSIAEGQIPWGLAPLLPASTRLRAGDVPPPGRPVVIAGRRLAQSRSAMTLIDTLTAAHRVAVIEMGWPAPWRPSGAAAFITTFGATRALSMAAAEALHLR